MARTVEVALVASTSQYKAAMAEAAAVTDATSDKIGASGNKAGEKFAAGIDKGTSKVGSLFKSLGSQASSFGLPFANEISKIGNEFDEVETKGKGFRDSIKAVGAVGVAALAGLAAESVHLADAFDKAQAALKTAVQNAGGDWATFQKQAGDAAKTSAALVTGNAEDIDNALSTLTTATQNPTKALQMLSLVENIAAKQHETLADASAQLAKVLGGNTRILAQWGINLDIGSGKLHSIQSAEEAVQSATLSLHGVQAEIADGQLQGAQASVALSKAQMTLRNDTLNLAQSQQAIPDILAALTERTQGAAAELGKTLPGEITVAKNSIHNLGIEFGEFLLPAINRVLAIGAQVLGFFQRNRDAAIALGVAVGGPLVAAMVTFAVSAAASAIAALGKIGIAVAELATTVVTKAATMTASMVGFGKEVQLTEATTVESMQGAEAATESAAVGIDTAIGSTGIGLAIVGLGVAVTEMLTHWQTTWTTMKTVASDASNWIINNVINPLISGFDRLVNTLTVGIVNLHGQLSNVGGSTQYGEVFGKNKSSINFTGTQSQASQINSLTNSLPIAKQTSAVVQQIINDVLSGNNSLAQKFAQLVAGGLSAGAAQAAASKSVPIGPTSAGSATGASTISQVVSFLSAQGFNKTAIAGILGNAQQESSMNPNTPGGGLWQQISNFGQGTGGSLQNQMQTMLPQIEGLKGALNAAGTPAQAAAIFEQGFERAGIPALANREKYATDLYSSISGMPLSPLAGGASISTPGSTIPNLTTGKLGVNTGVSGGAPLTTLTRADAILEDVAKRFQGGLQRAGQGGTGLTQQAGTVAAINAALSKGTQEGALVASLNATQNPTLVSLAQSIETTWSALTNKLATIIDTDTQKGQGELTKLQTAASATSFHSLKDAVTGQAATSFKQIVDELKDVHSKSLTGLVNQLETQWKLTMNDYRAVLATLSTTALADKIAQAAAGTQAKTAAAANVGSAAVTVSGLRSTAVVDNLNNASTALKDASALMSDAAAQLVQQIQAQTTAIQDAGNAQVTAINDQTQIQVDTLAERGLYGVDLQAQMAQVNLDQVKATDDAQIAAAQAHLDQVTASTNAAALAAQTNADRVQQTQDAAVARSQAAADTVAISSAVTVAAAQARADSVAFTDAINNAAAQAHVDAVMFGTLQQQQQAAANQRLVQAQSDAATATVDATLQTATNNANMANQNAQNAYNQTQANAQYQEALAQQQLVAAQTYASVQQALAQQQLTTLQTTAAVQQAQLQQTVSTLQEMAQVFFKGATPFNVNLYGISADNPMAYADAVGWELRTNPAIAP